MSQTPITPETGDKDDSTTAGGGNAQTPAPGSTGDLVRQAGTTLEQVVGEEMTALTQEVIEKLGVAKFIDENKPIIYGNLARFDQQAAATAETVNPDMMFIALSLPVINGIIHIASTQSGLNDAIAVVQGDPPRRNLDVISVLSALTLLYVAAQGKRDAATPEDVKTWTRILNRVKNFSRK